jgi:class 3 adenylate cyclase
MPNPETASVTRSAGESSLPFRPEWPDHAAVVACDIVGHSAAGRHDTMVARVRGINQVVGAVLARHTPDTVLWASGGDGGHVLFLNKGWRPSVLDLLRDLRAWAAREEVPLRIVAHYGPIEIIPGAEGGPQPVGDAINTAAWILTRATSAGIVVSSQFREALGPARGVEFHDPRRLPSKQGSPQSLQLLSLSDLGGRSRWSGPAAADQERLHEAVERGRGLEAVYLAKRLMLVNGEDRAVTRALAGLRPEHFGYNPVLGHLGPGNLRKLIGLAQLIELRYNDVLCRHGEPGSTMFVILRGQIGVYGTAEPSTGERAEIATHSEGEIVGELAFALNRRRTADLVALGDTAILSFEYEQLWNLLNGQGEMIWEFMTGRALEHVSQHVPYLIGRPLGELPDTNRREWEQLLRVLQTGCHIIARDQHKQVTLADLRRRDRRRTGAGGVYVLASGRLRSLSTEGKELDGERFPLLYVDLPDRLVAPDHEYVVDSGPAKIIFIGLEAVNQLPTMLHARFLQELGRALPSLYHYDAFISYNFGDKEVAERWASALTDRGLRVFRDSPTHLGVPYPEKDARALLDSLAVLVLVSPNAMVKDDDRNWVLKEVRFRERHFEKPWVVPVQLAQGDPQRLGIMYPAISADRREADAIEEATSVIVAIRNGEKEPPYALRRRSGTRID